MSTARDDQQTPLLPWTLSFMRPYRGRVLAIGSLMLLQVGLGALEPWPLKIVIDYVLGRLAAVVGDTAAARQHLLHSVQVAQRCGSKQWAGLAAAELARI